MVAADAARHAVLRQGVGQELERAGRELVGGAALAGEGEVSAELAVHGFLVAGGRGQAAAPQGQQRLERVAAFGGQAARGELVGKAFCLGVGVVGPSEVAATVPALLDPFGNSRALVQVEVESNGTVAALPMPLIAGPAYLQASRVRLGDTFSVTHHGQPGSFAIPSWAGAFPGFPIPIGGLGGAITLFPIFLTSPTIETLDATDVSSTAWTMPDLPQLVGVELNFQSIELTSLAPLSGRFTNAVAVRVEP